jgi:hypothetical protein
VNQNDQNRSDWTIRKLRERPREPISDKTVRDLTRERPLREVARIAKKYAR